MSDPASTSAPVFSSGITPQKVSFPPASDAFPERHLGPGKDEITEMLEVLELDSLAGLVNATVPEEIRLTGELDIPAPLSEHEALRELRGIAGRNRVFRSYLGMGYSDCITPPVIQRNILENPGWYTAYTPYQAEIAQGRLEALLNFQTMVCDLTGLEIANASLLDEATAAAEAMAMCLAHSRKKNGTTMFVSERCHPQTIAVLETRATPLGVKILVGDEKAFAFDEPIFAALLQYPATDGTLGDPSGFIAKVHEHGALAIVAADILGLVLLKTPGDCGADIAVGSTQRFGVPLGYGGPHAAFLATRDGLKRLMPGRLVGVSHDSHGKLGYRLSLQTREQHIRRDKATSNICTAQVLLAVIASMYAVYHGPHGLRRIAGRVHYQAGILAAALRRLGYSVCDQPFFDTIRVRTEEGRASEIVAFAAGKGINLRLLDDRTITVALDETVDDLLPLVKVFNGGETPAFGIREVADEVLPAIPESFLRTDEILQHPVFNTHHTETEMMRYLHRLESRDLSLTTSMIPLGSCTMKLNATAEMYPVTWPEIGRMHPFIPLDQAEGYTEIFSQLEKWLAEITGFAAVSLQPNAGSQGEYAGLLAIREYHRSRGDENRMVCLIPSSAHGTNPASAVMAGFKVVPVKCVTEGDIDLDDLREKAKQYGDDLACLMVTYPSTHGVFEETIREVCGIIHERGGQVYMDGANMNAQVGLCRPGDIGADVCHLNLHKTFCIPHGGGGPGMGPIGVASHLAPFLPDHPVVSMGSRGGIGPVSAAPWGSSSILVISWMYIRMMGSEGLTEATKIAILNANYMAKRLAEFYPVLFKGSSGLVAHECILDLRDWKERAGVEVEDIAKRLMDYGFHAPTVSWPVPGTMMIEPTESESKDELDRFCDAMISIHGEMAAIASGRTMF